MNQTLIERHRHINVDHDNWYDFVYDAFTDDMERLGVAVGKIYFSGFWSQGDGACFEGAVEDWDKFLTAVGYGDPVLIAHYHNNEAHFSVEHRGHYYHEMCTVFDDDYLPNLPFDNLGYTTVSEEDFLEEFGTGNEFRDAALIACLAQYDTARLVDDFKEFLRDKMRELYKRLEEEYEYLTSDDAVWEAIVANDLHIFEEELV